MANRLHVTQKRYAAEENAVLSEVVTNLQQATEPLTSDERIVCDCDEYLGNIMMDGHLLTFTNNGIDRVSEYGKALEQITASRELELFRQGMELWKKHEYVDFDGAGDDLKDALDEVDQQFYDVAGREDSLEMRVQRYVRDHLDAFVVLES